MVSDTVEILMWVMVYMAFMSVGYLIGVSRKVLANNDLRAKADMDEAEADKWSAAWDEETTRHAQTTEELLELQEDYQNLYRRDTKLRDGVKAHRAANNSNCNDLSCEKGCGHDLRLYKVLDETDVSVAGLFPSVDVNRKGIVFGGHQSIWDKVREGLPETEVGHHGRR